MRRSSVTLLRIWRALRGRLRYILGRLKFRVLATLFVWNLAAMPEGYRPNWNDVYLVRWLMERPWRRVRQ